MQASQLGAYQKRIDYARRTASLDHRRDTDPRVCPTIIYSDLLHKAFSYRMLHSSCHQLDLLHSHGVGMLSHVPTIRLQLGPLHSRNMRRPEVLGSIHWCLQLSHGRRNSCTTNARPVGAPNADQKEGRFERHVFYGHCVSIALLLSHFSVLEVRPGYHEY